MRSRLPRERPAEPPRGYKLAHPVLSHDGERIGFAGVSIGGAAAYGVLDEARCVYGRRHRSPTLRCDCGFYCLHTLADALSLTRTDAHRRAALLEITVLGVYIRFERGMRYARQRVRVMRVGPCCCGLPSEVLADAGWGRSGWQMLTGACAGCVAGRDAVSFADFARIGGEGLRVVAGHLQAEDRTGPAGGPDAGSGLRDGRDAYSGLWAASGAGSALCAGPDGGCCSRRAYSGCRSACAAGMPVSSGRRPPLGLAHA